MGGNMWDDFSCPILAVPSWMCSACSGSEFYPSSHSCIDSLIPYYLLSISYVSGNVPDTECMVGPSWQSPCPLRAYRPMGKLGTDWKTTPHVIINGDQFLEGKKRGDWKINDQVRHQGRLPEEVICKWGDVGPAAVIQAKTGEKNVPGRGNSMCKGHKAWGKEGIVECEGERGWTSPRLGWLKQTGGTVGLLYHMHRGYPWAPCHREGGGSPTWNARILKVVIVDHSKSHP